MPARSKVSTLPSAIRQELHTKLIENNCGRLEEVSAWLKKQGYDISKSAIHRYSQEWIAEKGLSNASDNAESDKGLRMRCLEVAVQKPPEVDLIGVASPLLSWVQTGRRTEGGE